MDLLIDLHNTSIKPIIKCKIYNRLTRECSKDVTALIDTGSHKVIYAAGIGVLGAYGFVKTGEKDSLSGISRGGDKDCDIYQIGIILNDYIGNGLYLKDIKVTEAKVSLPYDLIIPYTLLNKFPFSFCRFKDRSPYGCLCIYGVLTPVISFKQSKSVVTDISSIGYDFPDLSRAKIKALDNLKIMGVDT